MHGERETHCVRPRMLPAHTKQSTTVLRIRAEPPRREDRGGTHGFKSAERSQCGRATLAQALVGTARMPSAFIRKP